MRHAEDTRSWDAEFDGPPLDLIPIEVFAINRLRAASGIGEVAVDHPLMRTIGPVVSARPPAEVVEILSRVQEKHDEFYGR